MRLIDADKIIDSLGMSDMDFAIGAVIDDQPTAFDVDKVVESLTNKFRIVSNDEDLEWNRAIDCVAKIVKGGGVE
nr:MAG TPA: hypothetical protein [Caudoviricetes sp.]